MYKKSAQTRENFKRHSKKMRLRKIWALPLLAASAISLSGLLWFAFTKPLSEAKPPLTPAAQALTFTVRAAGEALPEELQTGADLAYGGNEAMMAAEPYTLAKDGLRVIFLQVRQNAVWNEQMALDTIADARSKYDVIGLNLFWGGEFARSTGEVRRQLAHRLIEGGADVIVGYGLPELQGTEIHENGLILYSLGSAPEAMAVELKLSCLGWQSALLIPLGEPAQAAAIREKARSVSAGLGATLSLNGEKLEVKK